MPLPKQQFLSALGTPLVGGKVYTYAAGTSNPKATYTDAAGTINQPNPIPLNVRGEPASPIYWSGNYRVEVRDLLDNLVYTVDNYNTDPAGLWQLVTSAGASLIGFIQAGVGAVARTIQSKLREIMSVEDFGADSDAVDNTAAFQAAIDAVASAGGGQLRIGAKTYNFTGTVVLKSKVELVGRGAASTILQQNTASLPLIKSDQFDTLTGTNNPGGIRRACIRGMTLQGTLSGSVPAGTTTQNGVAIFGYGCVFEDVQIRYFGGVGLYTEWATPGTAPDSGYFDGFTENRVFGLKSYMNGLSGIKCAGANDGQWLGVISYSNNLNDTSADKPNVWVTAKGNPQHFTQLHAWGNSSGVALLLEGSANCSNCELEGATAVQLKIKTGEVTYRGGRIFAAGSTSSIGMQFVGGPGVCIGYNIDTDIENDNGGSIDFGTGIDSYKINVRAFQSSGTVMLGTIPTAGVGKSLKVQFGGGANNRATIQREYSITATNLSLTGASDTGFEYVDHGGEGVISFPQRKTEPAGTYYPASGLVGYARVNALRFHQSSSNTIGALMGEPAAAVAAVDNLDCSFYQTTTLAAAGAPVTINNLTGGLNGAPIFILMPSGGSEITLTTTGNIRAKSGANITRSGLGSNRLIGFVKARDGNYYQI
jgi:hypothetical protein